MQLLQAAGVPAGMVQRSSDHLEDPQLAHRRFFRRLEHPEMGEVPYEGHQFAIERLRQRPALPGARASASTPTRCSPRSSASTTTRSPSVLGSGACG